MQTFRPTNTPCLIASIAAADKAVDVSGNIARATLDGSIGAWRAVRRHDHIRELMERVARGARRRIVRARIAPPGVERRSADDPIAQGAVKGLLVGDRAARQIDQKGAGLHRGKPAASISFVVSGVRAQLSTSMSHSPSI